MAKGLIMHDEYGDVGRCDSCNSENVGRKKFESAFPKEPSERMLCYLCASSFVSQHQMYNSEAAPITTTIAYMANAILKEMRGVSQEQETE